MPETKKKLPVFGREVDVSEVPITASEENVNHYTLEDGTTLKVKGVATSVMRIDNQFLPDGNPIYIVVMTPVVSVESSPLRKVPETAESAEGKANLSAV